MDAATPLIVGRITGVYGIRGWVKVASFTDPVDNLLAYRPWMIEVDGVWQELAVAEARAHGKGFVARIEGVSDRDEARRFTGRDLAVPRTVLPETEAGEYYWFELEGLRVLTTGDVDLGRVTRVLATGANDVLVVEDDGRERLLPFVADVVLDVETGSGIIRVDWDPEL